MPLWTCKLLLARIGLEGPSAWESISATKMEAIYKTYLTTPIGYLEIVGTDHGIQEVTFKDAVEDHSEIVPEALQEAVIQLKEYFIGERKGFDLQLVPDGTPFQKQVWRELQQIPFGKQLSYQELANRLGDPKVIRAAAGANAKNPIGVIIPCHRVVGSDGGMVGYAGGIHRKKWLLAHESPVRQGRIILNLVHESNQETSEMDHRSAPGNRGHFVYH